MIALDEVKKFFDVFENSVENENFIERINATCKELIKFF